MDQSRNVYRWQKGQFHNGNQYKVDNTKSYPSQPIRDTVPPRIYNSNYSTTYYSKSNSYKSGNNLSTKWVNPSSKCTFTSNQSVKPIPPVNSNPSYKYDSLSWKSKNKTLIKTHQQSEVVSEPVNTRTKWTKNSEKTSPVKILTEPLKIEPPRPTVPKKLKFLSKTKLVRECTKSLTPKRTSKLKVNTRNKLIRLNITPKTQTRITPKLRKSPHLFKFIRKDLHSKKNSLKYKSPARYQTTQFRYVSINGKTYKTNGHSLKRQSLDGTKNLPTLCESFKKTRLNKVKRLQPGQLTAIVRKRQRVSVVPKRDDHCLTFGMTGKCLRYQKRMCPFVHDVEKIAICTRFLQGNCQVKNCPFSHKYCRSKMPTCVHFIEGFCHKENCKYRHVKVSQDAPLCVNFLRGVCTENEECTKKHVLTCPEFQNNGKCSYGKACPLSHRKLKPKVSRPMSSKLFHVTRKWGTIGTGTSGRKDPDALDLRYFDPSSAKPDSHESVRHRLLKQVGQMTSRSIPLDDDGETEYVAPKPLPAVLDEFIPL